MSLVVVLVADDIVEFGWDDVVEVVIEFGSLVLEKDVSAAVIEALTVVMNPAVIMVSTGTLWAVEYWGSNTANNSNDNGRAVARSWPTA